MEDIFLSEELLAKEFAPLYGQVCREKFPLLVNGLSLPEKAHMAYFLSRRSGRRVVMICPNEAEAEKLREDLSFYLEGRVLFLRSEEMHFYTIEAKDRKEESLRIASLMRLAGGNFDILVLSAETLMQRYMPPELYRRSRILLSVGQVCDPEELTRRLSALGYERESRTESAGQFSMRGGILDIFVPTEEEPFRLEFFDDEVDSIRVYDRLSQKSVEKRQRIEITPARELLFPEDTHQASSMIRAEIERNRLSSEDLLHDAERIRQGQYFEGMNRYLPYFFGEEATDLFAYLPKDALYVLNEPNRALDKAENYYREFTENYQSALEKGFALPNQGELIFSPAYMTQMLSSRPLILNSYMPRSIAAFKVAGIVNIRTQEPLSFQGKIPRLTEELAYMREKGYTVLLVERDADTLRSLTAELRERGTEIHLLGSRTAKLYPGAIFILQGRLSEGYVYPDAKIALFTDKEIFGVSKQGGRKKAKSRHKGQQIDSFVDLNVGDYVVHETYGVGKFAGIEAKKFDEIRKDYIKVVYNGGDALYVPLSSMDKIRKYIGGGREQVRLSKLGTSEWKKAKSKAKKSVEEIARYLIELYARRREARGYAFSGDTPWQKEFETLFPYEETADQLTAIAEVKRDMEALRPMDRLICGDVGYGKTEVAIRAIFKSCMDSKQSAFLVPTTILAQQHYNTLKERFADYPIRLEVVSRFKTRKEQEKILEDVKRGLVDVLIGTHRILSKDVEFQDLGLLVVDEEQRFGVRHKELLKQLKKNVDVLTLSATPIPRTLHLSLSGIRDMSILEEPPEDRRPIMTYVTEAREGIIADAIEREIARGGQVFFVYNRVETIEKMAYLLKQLVPSARIATAHGQMTATRLEDIMVDFLEKEYDVLLCTTIIETGMDIANANTMIVYDADHMGLSQLYQLRGRVGRSARQAYAYFMYQRDKVLTEVSEKRLRAIKEFTEFGSGFKIAMRDLEIRGAGNILGERQHGHMAEIGYDLYVKMLDQAVRTMSGQQIEEKVETEIEFDISAYIPESYIEDEMTKIEIYKKIASIDSKQEMMDMEEEIEDRFSDLPHPTRNLLMIAYIKSLASRLGVVRITQHKTKIHFISKEEKDSVKRDFEETEDYKLMTKIAEFLELMI
ncbi:MAG: transcription-repair coupling factor [Peptostreptococcaceae bacterium]|nr:transcription-repair coupling factor [Peptostreptococcaceae bacterium]